MATHHLSKWYGQVSALNDVSVSVPPGITGLLGPNGAGKSTLIRMMTTLLPITGGRALINGVYAPDSGRVKFRGVDITGEPPYRIARHGLARLQREVDLVQRPLPAISFAYARSLDDHDPSSSSR